MQTSKLLWTDTEDWITCEIRGYWKDWICYVKDVINKRSEHLPEESPSDIGEKIDSTLKWIDKTETECDYWRWETSTWANFWKNKLKELKDSLSSK